MQTMSLYVWCGIRKRAVRYSGQFNKSVETSRNANPAGIIRVHSLALCPLGDSEIMKYFLMKSNVVFIRLYIQSVNVRKLTIKYLVKDCVLSSVKRRIWRVSWAFLGATRMQVKCAVNLGYWSGVPLPRTSKGPAKRFELTMLVSSYVLFVLLEVNLFWTEYRIGYAI